jgi:hypothetical protein
MAFDLFRRDQQRTRILTGLSLLFWILGTAGILLLVINLNRMMLDGQNHSYGSPHPSVFQPAPDDPINNLIHQDLRPIAFTKICAVVEASVVALLIAALLTVALIFSSRQTTLNRINISLMQISEQLSRVRQNAPPGGGTPAMPADMAYSLPPASGRFGMGGFIKALIVLALLLLLGMPALWLTARRQRSLALEEEARAHANLWHNYRRLSPFEAVKWKGQTPHIQIGGRWYELLSIDGLSADHVVALCQVMDPRDWQKRFEEDLVQVLTQSGHAIGVRATLEVKDLETGHVQVLKDVPMTEENRQALRRAGTTRPAPSLALPRSTGGGD